MMSNETEVLYHRLIDRTKNGQLAWSFGPQPGVLTTTIDEMIINVSGLTLDLLDGPLLANANIYYGVRLAVYDQNVSLRAFGSVTGTEQVSGDSAATSMAAQLSTAVAIARNQGENVELVHHPLLFELAKILIQRYRRGSIAGRLVKSLTSL
jgi:hypothetical protein